MIRVPSFLAIAFLSAILLSSFTSRACAADLRVPEDFDSIQRAILAADSGDTINIAAGTYRENLSISDTVVLRGAGIGKTIIVAPNREQPIVTVYSEGAVTLSDLTLSHAEAVPDVTEPNTTSSGLDLSGMSVVLRNIRIEKTPALYVLSSKGNLLTVENLTVAAEKPFVCISLEWTKPGTRFDRVFLPEQDWGTAIKVDNGAAVFRDIMINPAQKAGISVSGSLADVKFPDLSPEILAKVEWSYASPNGPTPEAIAAHKKEILDAQEERSAEDKAAIEVARQQALKVLTTRRRLLREFQASLKKSPTADAGIAAFALLLPKLHELYIGENDSYSDSGLDQIVNVELRAIHDRFGVAALAKALELPGYDKAPLSAHLETNLGFDLRDSIATFEAARWVKTSYPDLPALLSSWKTAPKSNPSTARDAFLTMLKNVSAKATDSTPPKAKKALTDLALSQVPAFAAQFGTVTLDHLLRSLARETPPIVTLAQVSGTLSDEQKSALIQLWKTQ
jgi:hypothetical protein